jgi:hypothetical protein
MSHRILAALILLTLSPSAEAACIPSDIVVVDRSRFKSTIDNARSVLSGINFQSEAADYTRGDVRAFAAQSTYFKWTLHAAETST